MDLGNPTPLEMTLCLGGASLLVSLAALLRKSHRRSKALHSELANSQRELNDTQSKLDAQSQQLQQITSDLAARTSELQEQQGKFSALHESVSARETGLHTLLESSRWMRGDLAQDKVMDTICRAAVLATNHSATAGAILRDQEGQLSLAGQFGFGADGTNSVPGDFASSFATIIIKQQHSAFIEDLDRHPETSILQPSAGRRFRSALGAPVWVRSRPLAVIKLYSEQPHAWTSEQARILEWFASYVGLTLQALQYHNELEQRRREAERSSEQKTQFLAAVSHDVRTPANAISLLSQVLEQAVNNNRNHEVPQLARDLNRNARTLMNLVNELLDLSKLESGNTELQMSTFSLEALIDTELRQQDPIAHAKGLLLRREGTTGGIWLHSDKMKLARILSNLVGNAVKFTDSGVVSVQCSRSSAGHIDLFVRDTGPGIAPEQLPRIFDEFYQVRNPERDHKKGSGLGLAICHRLVQCLGCTLTAQSQQGKGSIFTLRIPQHLMVSAPIRRGVIAGMPQVSNRLQGRRILLVEDHDLTRRAASTLLAAHGATVVQAPTGRTALQLLRHENPTILLLDLMLPDMDGTEILREVQESRPDSLRCILAVSGDARPERLAEVCRLGADGLIPKPLDIQELVNTIEGYLQDHPLFPAINRHADTLQA